MSVHQSDLKLRRAVPEDFDLLVGLNRQLIQDQQHDRPASPEELQRRWQNWLAGAYQVGLVELDGEPVAYAVWRDDADGIYVRHFFVARDQRRSGIGRRAFALLEAEWDGRVLMLDALLHNQRALGFWRALGFQDYSLILRKVNPAATALQ